MVPFKLFFRRGPSWIIMTWLLTVPFYAISLHQKLNQVTVAEQSDSLGMATVWVETRLCNSFVNLLSLFSLPAYSFSFSDARVSQGAVAAGLAVTNLFGRLRCSKVPVKLCVMLWSKDKTSQCWNPQL